MSYTNTGNLTGIPLDMLYVGLGSHDRDITDTSLYNQTDLITEFRTGPVTHLLITGLELGQDTNDTQNYSRNIPGNTNNYFRAVPLLSPANAGAFRRDARHFVWTSLAKRQAGASSNLRRDLAARGIDSIFIARKKRVTLVRGVLARRGWRGRRPWSCPTSVRRNRPAPSARRPAGAGSAPTAPRSRP